VVRCVPNDFVGGHTLAAVRCPTGLLFDLDGQVCDWAHRVSNCDKLTKPRNARPNFKTQVEKGFHNSNKCSSNSPFKKKKNVFDLGTI